MRKRSSIAAVLLAAVVLLVLARHKREMRTQESQSSSSQTSIAVSLPSSKVTQSSLPAVHYTLGGGTYDRTLTFGGRERQYRLHVPSSYKTSSSYGLVIAMHGGGGDIENAEKSMGWNAEADRKGFLVVYPQGTGKSALGKMFGTWNGGICCGFAVQNKVDDVGFIRAMLDAISQEFNVDQKRIYATGISNGGMMSYRLACDLSDRIAAIGPVAGQFDGGQQCHPSRSVPILHLHGLADPCAKMEGGTCGGCFNDYLKALHIPAENNDTWQCTAVEGTVETWAKRNGCSGAEQIISNKGGVKCVSFGCSANGETELCTIEGMGHQWPGGDNEVPSCKTKPNGLVCTSWKKTVGAESDALNGTDALWVFFAAHPMR